MKINFVILKNENKIYYVINYSQKNIFIFLKNLTSKQSYKILKNNIENDENILLPMNLLRVYYNYFENKKLSLEIDASPGRDFYSKYIQQKIFKDIVDFKEKNQDFTFQLVDDNIYDDDTNKILLSKIALYCCDNASKNSYEKIFAWFNKSGNLIQSVLTVQNILLILHKILNLKFS